MAQIAGGKYRRSQEGFGTYGQAREYIWGSESTKWRRLQRVKHGLRYKEEQRKINYFNKSDFYNNTVTM